MLAIGRALMAGPRVLLLDEPSLGLAPRIVERLGEVIREINRQGVTVVLVEQNAALALAVADRAVVLEVGNVTLEGLADELASSQEVRDRYLGIGATTRPSPPTCRRVDRPRRAARWASSKSTPCPSASAGSPRSSELSFRVAPGSMHALIGPNGAGKSTCLNVLSGVYEATAGSVRYGGARADATAPPPGGGARGLAHVPEHLAVPAPKRCSTTCWWHATD